MHPMHWQRLAAVSCLPTSLRLRARRTTQSCLFSAPGEGREAVEIARRLLQEAARGVPFDRNGRAPARAADLSRRARTRARSRRHSRLVPSRHAAARSGRPRAARAARVRGRGAVGAAIRRVCVARPGAAQRSRQRRPLVAARRRDRRGRAAARRSRRGRAARRGSAGADRSRRIRSRPCRHLARAVAMGGPDRRSRGDRQARSLAAPAQGPRARIRSPRPRGELG